MTDATELIARLEKATRPDRELDRLIEETLPGVLRHPHRDSIRDGYAISGPGHPIYPPGQGILPPHYTASIDGALTLVPEGWAWSVHDGGCYATGKLLKPRAELAEPIQTQFGPGVGVRAQVEAATPAIALCIAALKVRGANSQ